MRNISLVGIYTVTVIFYPFFLFGNLGFYGDDFNMLLGLQDEGYLGSLKTWSEEYGKLYRPIGISLLTAIYLLFGDSSLFMYSFSFLLYVVLALFIFITSREIFKSNTFSFFLTILFVSFPLNATAFLQLSSMYMIFTILAFLYLIKKLHKQDIRSYSHKFYILVFIWTLLLLSYEQVTGLILLIYMILFYQAKSSHHIDFKNLFVKSIIFTTVTLMFMVVYFIQDGNPKMITVETLNQASVNFIESTEHSEQEMISSTLHDSRLSSLIDKIDRTFIFLKANTTYSFIKIAETGLVGYVLLTLLIFPIIFITKFKIQIPTIDECCLFILVGMSWILATLAPFALYSSLHIPPYVLLIPSIGCFIFLFGIYWLVIPAKYHDFGSNTFKIGMCISLLFFQINQFGVYAGIKEELSYWERVSTQINLYGRAEKILERDNLHLFWAEKLYGHRHFRNLTKKDIYDFHITKNGLGYINIEPLN